MGNCLVLREKVIKIMKTDGKILEYKAPLKVHDVLSDFSGHAVSDKLPVLRHLRPDTNLLGGHLYYLIPLQLPSPEVKKKKKVKFSNAEVDAGQGTGVMRIKLVISKQDMQVILRKGGISVDEIVSQLQSRQSINEVDMFDGNRKGWKPMLESIPELY